MVENDFKFFSDAEELFNFDVEHVEMVHWDHPMKYERGSTATSSTRRGERLCGH
ncbi:hypothetical protein JL09_g6934 [Pichia kudriavzevii]|uniref:Uncharacterized protein n=1 Tax=Pichia kudriavzevii TaxID=4909 RepID=A0A099NK31_PICKU|nr:hypothetical protein JL09_g6934 [Pichia kudriavzevii]